MQNIYTGIPLRYIGNGQMEVWIPMKSFVPLGEAKGLYANTGSNLHGDNLDAVSGSVIVCDIASKPGPSGPWEVRHDKGASIFGSGYREGDGIPFYPANIRPDGRDDNVAKRRPPIPQFIDMPQAYGAANYSACSLLQSTGGEPVPSFINAPKGEFNIPGEGERVLVVFRDNNIDSGVIIGSQHRREDWEQTTDFLMNRIS